MRLITGVLSLLVLGLILFYFMPADFRQKTSDSISELDFIPESIKDKAADILLAPPQRRERLITELENQLENLSAAIEKPVKQGASAVSTAVGSPEEIIAKAEKILQKIKENNIDTGIIEQLQKLVTSKEGCEKKP